MKTIFIALSILGFLFSGESTATYSVDGMMSSKSCVQKVKDSLNGVKGIKSYKVDFTSKTTTVIFDNEIINSDKIAKTIANRTYFEVNDLDNKITSPSFWDWLFGGLFRK